MSENKPEIEPGKMAETDESDDIAEEIDESAEWYDDEDDAETVESEFDEFDELGDADVTIGDIYCRGLTALSNELVKNYGSGDAPFESENGELDLTLAKNQLYMDYYVNKLMESHGKRNDISPGAALAISTAMFAFAVVGSDPELIAGLRDEIRGDSNE